MAKVLLRESMMVAAKNSNLQESVGLPRYQLVESAGLSEDYMTGPMKIRLPVTTYNKKNENGRTYSRTVLENACRNAKPTFESRELLCTINGHPKESYVEPGDASHICTAAWCESDGYLWNEWDVMETGRGKDLRALIKAEASFGVSIRGLGSQDAAGNILEDYEYLGTDGVGNPSAKIRTRPSMVQSGHTRESVDHSTQLEHTRGAPMSKQAFTESFNNKLAKVNEHVKKNDFHSVVREQMELEEMLNSEGGRVLTITEAHEYAGRLARSKSQAREKMTGTGARAALESALSEGVKKDLRIKQLEAALGKSIERIKSAGKVIERQNARIAYERRTARTKTESLVTENTQLKSRLKKAGTVVREAIQLAGFSEAKARAAVHRTAVAETKLSEAIKQGGKMVAEARRGSDFKGGAPAKESTDPKNTGKVVKTSQTKTESTKRSPYRDQPMLIEGKKHETAANKRGEVRVPGFA